MSNNFGAKKKNIYKYTHFDSDSSGKNSYVLVAAPQKHTYIQTRPPFPAHPFAQKSSKKI